MRTNMGTANPLIIFILSSVIQDPKPRVRQVVPVTLETGPRDAEKTCEKTQHHVRRQVGMCCGGLQLWGSIRLDHLSAATTSPHSSVTSGQASERAGLARLKKLQSVAEEMLLL